MAAGEVVTEGRQHQPSEREQAQAPGESFNQGHGECAQSCAVVSLGERVGSPVLFLKVTFSAGAVAAPARSPKPPLCGAGVQLLADGVTEVQDVDQFFKEAYEWSEHNFVPYIKFSEWRKSKFWRRTHCMPRQYPLAIRCSNSSYTRNGTIRV